MVKGFRDVLFLIALPCAAPLAGQTTTRVSLGPGGVQGDHDSYFSALSMDGRLVAFYSEASNLVAGDTNGVEDVFVRDRVSQTTIRVSVDSAGVQADGDSEFPVFSGDGRFVAFHSLATNLVPGDTNGTWDVFVHDLQTGATERVSVDSSGVGASGESTVAALSADGRFVAFTNFGNLLVPGDTNDSPDVFLRDRLTGTTTRISLTYSGGQANRGGAGSTISDDGRYVLFESSSSNLVPGTMTAQGIYRRDVVLGTTTCASVDSNGVLANSGGVYSALSGDGRYASFDSYATNLVPGDTNAHADVFVHDFGSGTTTRVSVSSAGVQANGDSTRNAISADGRFAAFVSQATNLVAGDTNGVGDIFVHDLVTGITERASVSSLGAQGDAFSSYPALSANGRHVSFFSAATDLVPLDTNGSWDVFVHDLDKIRRR